MKKMIMSVAVLVLSAGLFVGCGSNSRTDSANRNTENNSYPGTNNNNNTGTVNDRNAKNATNDVAAAEFRKFRLDAEDQTSAVDREIAQIRKRITAENASNRKDLEDRLQKIEDKNNKIKKDLGDFKDDASADRIQKFKDDFYKDITVVRQDVQNFWANNGKTNNKMNRDNRNMNNNRNDQNNSNTNTKR